MLYNYVAGVQFIHTVAAHPKTYYFGITDEEYRRNYYLVGECALVKVNGVYDLYAPVRIVEIKSQSEVPRKATKPLLCYVDYEHCIEK